MFNNDKGIFLKASSAPAASTGPLKTPAWMTNAKAVKGIQDRRQGQGNVQENGQQDGAPTNIPQSALDTCNHIDRASPAEIRKNLEPVFRDESYSLDIDERTRTLIARDLDSTNAIYIKRAGRDICQAAG